MQLTEHLRALRRHWLLIAVMAVLGLMLAEGASLAATPQYSARSVAYFSLPNGTSGTDLSAGSTYAQSQVESYAQLATTPSVLDPVIKKYALAESATALGNSLDVTVVQGTVMVAVVATNPSPEKAALLANGVTESLGARVRALSPRSAVGKASVDATVVTKASTPKSPASPRTKRNVVAGTFGGLLIGVVIAILREITDTRILNSDDLAGLTDAPIIGQVGATKLASRDVEEQEWVHSPEMEAIRRVRTNLSFLGVDHRPLAVAVTSAMPGEGKSTIALNLAAALGEAGQKVLLLDADLRRPQIGRMTNLDEAVGLTAVLIGKAELDDAVQPWGANGVEVLPAGEVPPNPAELLESTGMERLMKEVRTRYDVIVIDTAPLVPVAETAALSRLISGFVLVARSRVVKVGQFTEALSTLDTVGARLFGIVMNGLSGREAPPYGYAPHSDGDRRPPSKPRRGRRMMKRDAQFGPVLGTRESVRARTTRAAGQAARVAD